MMYLCQFGQNLAIGLVEKIADKAFSLLYAPDGLEN